VGRVGVGWGLGVGKGVNVGRERVTIGVTSMVGWIAGGGAKGFQRVMSTANINSRMTTRGQRGNRRRLFARVCG